MITESSLNACSLPRENANAPLEGFTASGSSRTTCQRYYYIQKRGVIQIKNVIHRKYDNKKISIRQFSKNQKYKMICECMYYIQYYIHTHTHSYLNFLKEGVLCLLHHSDCVLQREVCHT